MNNRHHTYYTIIGSGIAILFSMIYAFLGAQLESAKIICYVIGGIGLLSLIAALLDLIINLKREKVIGAFLYASAGATVALVILGILTFNIPTVEKSSWDMLIVISGLALIVTGLLAMGATALERSSDTARISSSKRIGTNSPRRRTSKRKSPTKR